MRETVTARVMNLGQVLIERSELLMLIFTGFLQQMNGFFQQVNVIIVFGLLLLCDPVLMFTPDGAHVQLNPRHQSRKIRVIGRNKDIQDSFELDPGHQGVLCDGVVTVQSVGQQGLVTHADNVQTLPYEPCHEIPVVVVALFAKSSEDLEKICSKEKVGCGDGKVAGEQGLARYNWHQG